MTSTQRPEQPEWGRLIQDRREQQGRSVRQAAYLADLSDAYWGQVEKGYVTVKGQHRPVTPSRRALLAISDSLRLTPAERSAVLLAAGHKPYVADDLNAPRESEVDLHGLSRRDVALLNAIADRFRETVTSQPAPQPTGQRRPLRAVASGQRTPGAQAEAARVARKAREGQRDR